jgi:hypothetical protein
MATTVTYQNSIPCNPYGVSVKDIQNAVAETRKKLRDLEDGKIRARMEFCINHPPRFIPYNIQ